MPEVTFAETPQDGDTLITVECMGLFISFLKGDDDEAETKRQKQIAVNSLYRALCRRGQFKDN